MNALEILGAAWLILFAAALLFVIYVAIGRSKPIAREQIMAYTFGKIAGHLQAQMGDGRPVFVHSDDPETMASRQGVQDGYDEAKAEMDQLEQWREVG